MSFNQRRASTGIREGNGHQQQPQQQFLVHRQVDKYDGQSVWINDIEVYELGNYLGGGASGSVYQATDLNHLLPTERQVAIKILNPVGFKLFPINQMNKCDVLRKGLPLSLEQHHGKSTMVEDNIWWLHHPSSRQILAAYEDLRTGQLRELTLPKCVEVWGWSPFGERDNQLSSDEEEKYNISTTYYSVNGVSRPIPRVAPKFLKWLRSRQSICREVSSMMQIGEHRNIIKLYEILELIQDSKTTLFLVLELVTGGEMFERMKVGRGNSEASVRKFFQQLLSGIEYCHERGVCHRDLKPENLLLSDSSDNAILKIADFGLSAVIFAAVATENSSDQMLASQSSLEKLAEDEKNFPLDDLDLCGAPVKRLRSVVGSPHYVAPEITDGNSSGYDGRKVDMWSAGVILYGLLTGSLPFGRDLSACPRFKRFKKWIFTEFVEAMQAGKDPLYPSFLFPSHVSSLARLLIVQLLHPDPVLRLSANEAAKHRWLHVTNLSRINARDETPKLGQISRQPSPNSSKENGRPPRPSSGQSSPSQIACLLPISNESKHESSSLMIPALSRNSSPSDQSGAKATESLMSSDHQTEQVFELGDSVSPVVQGEEDDDIVDLTMLNISSSNPQVVSVEDDRDYCGVEDSIWREIDSVDHSL